MRSLASITASTAMSPSSRPKARCSCIRTRRSSDRPNKDLPGDIGQQVLTMSSKSRDGGPFFFPTRSMPRPGQTEVAEKMNYVMHFAPWGWTLMTGVYMDDIAAMSWSYAIPLVAHRLCLGGGCGGDRLARARRIQQGVGPRRRRHEARRRRRPRRRRRATRGARTRPGSSPARSGACAPAWPRRRSSAGVPKRPRAQPTR